MNEAMREAIKVRLSDACHQDDEEFYDVCRLALDGDADALGRVQRLLTSEEEAREFLRYVETHGKGLFARLRPGPLADAVDAVVAAVRS